MRLRQPSLPEWVVAACCGIWVAASLWSSGWAMLAGAVSAALVVVARQHPLPAGAGLAAMQVLLAAAGLSASNGAGLVPFFVAVYSLGRFAPLWPGIVVAACFPLSALLEPGDPATVVFALLLTGAVLAYGRVVRRRALGAERSRATAMALQATDVAAEAARVVADERARLGGQALTVLREAVTAMRAEAAAARVDLDAERIEAVAARGRQAVTELRWLLGLLRSGAGAGADVGAAPDHRSRRLPVLDLLGAAMLLLVGVLEAASSDAGEAPSVWFLVVALAGCVALRSRWTDGALAGGAVSIAIAAVAAAPLLIAPLVAVLVLIWAAAARGGTRPWVALASVVVAMIAWTARDELDNVPLVTALAALTAFAGHEWSAHARAERADAARVAGMQTELQAEVEAARRAERLRVARELHDVASHAIGTMVLQASAAGALRQHEPARAREALGIIEVTAQQALVELTMLFALLDSGAIGSPGLAGARSDPLPDVVARHRRAGLDIAAELEPVPPGLEPTVHRIVQESLTNVVRHSDACRVRVTATVADGVLAVRVADDGHPVVDRVVADASVEGFGLRGLAERVEALGGRFRAEPGEAGFTVEATLPVDAAVRP
ncbi:MAG: sensor histidine kinase [Actinomycetota bacterium]